MLNGIGSEMNNWLLHQLPTFRSPNGRLTLQGEGKKGQDVMWWESRGRSVGWRELGRGEGREL